MNATASAPAGAVVVVGPRHAGVPRRRVSRGRSVDMPPTPPRDVRTRLVATGRRGLEVDLYTSAMLAAPLATNSRLDDLVFLGFNRRVVALDRYSGEIRWDWKASKGGGYVSLLIDGDRLIVNCQGYTWCLDPLSGDEVWFQPLKGFGMGIACIASVRGGSSSTDAGAAESHAAAANAAASCGAAGAAS